MRRSVSFPKGAKEKTCDGLFPSGERANRAADAQKIADARQSGSSAPARRIWLYNRPATGYNGKRL